MRTNNNNLVDFSNKQTYVASESLVQEAIVRDWFFDNGHLEPNYVDYSEHDLNEYIKHYNHD